MFKNLSTESLGVSGRQSEIIELALSSGFKGIELDLVDFGEQSKAKGLAHARRLLDSSRLKIGPVRLNLRWDAEEADFQADVVQALEAADLASQVGATVATVTILPSSDLKPYHENFELHRRRVAELAKRLQEKKMRLGIGFFAPEKSRDEHAYSFVSTADALLMILKMIDAPGIGLDLDVWHWHLGGGTLDQLRALGKDKIVAVSLADAEVGATAKTADDSGRMLPGESGQIDAPAYMSLLSELGYQGAVTPRPHPGRFAGWNREKIVKETAAAFDRVWKPAKR